MRREIEQLLNAWRQERAEEERIFADIMLALETGSRNRRAWLDDLADALKGYGSPQAVAGGRFELHPQMDDIERAIHEVRGSGRIAN